MNILNAYQFAFLATIVIVTIIAARAAKTFIPVSVLTDSAPASQPQTQSSAEIKASPLKVWDTKTIPDQLRALNELFDRNVVSVDEYVELRRRITHVDAV